MIENKNEDLHDYNSLLQELQTNRSELHHMLNKVKEVRDKIDTIIGTKNDLRYKNINEDKMKTITEVIKTELEIRKQIDNSIKSEMDVVKKRIDQNKATDEDLTPDNIKRYIEDFIETK